MADLLRSLPARGVQLLSTDVVDNALEALGAAGEIVADELRILSRCWSQLPGPRDLIDETLDGLAKVALDVWPDWFAAVAGEAIEAPAVAVATCQARIATLGLNRRVNAAWLAQAVRLCQDGRLPRPSAFPNAVQAEQLSLVLSPLPRIVVLAIAESRQVAGTLLGVARVAEWLAAEGDLSVLVIAPDMVACSSELEAISFARSELAFAPPELAEEEPAIGSVALPHRSKVVQLGQAARLVTPLIGRPHPNSSGEQLLWAALVGDPELCELFQCNQRVDLETLRPIVDLVCRQLKLVVEIDGYYWHSNEEAFCRDRSRDFLLVLAGYLVIRLPHDEVVSDVGAALEKVRSLVRFRKNR